MYISTTLTEEDDFPPRTCSECGVRMVEGFCIEEGQYYFCSEECLLKTMSWEDYLELHDDGEGDSYWTMWEDEAVDPIYVCKKCEEVHESPTDICEQCGGITRLVDRAELL